MKKKIIFLSVIILFVTGCTTEYNLTIDDNVYKESITIVGSDSQEISNLDKEWKIPVDKREYDIISGFESVDAANISKMYLYTVSDNKLIFKNNFTIEELGYSTAISTCYNKATIINYGDYTIISTSDKVICFDTHPPLTNLKISITVDNPVLKHNADMVDGRTYIWNINKNNKNDKSINMIIDNSKENLSPNNSSDTQKNDISSLKKKDYTLYIFLLVIVIIILVIYFVFNTIKKNNDDID